MKRLFFSLLIALLPATSWGQATVLQGGSFTSGLLPIYSSAGGTSQPVIQQSATAAGGAQSIKEMSIVARGSGSAPYTASGGGLLGSQHCLYDGPTTGAYRQLCLGVNVTGGFGLLSYNAYGGATAQTLKFNINGSTYEFPFSDGFVVGPASSTVDNVACWNNTTGTLLKDCGTFPSVGGTANQIQYNSAGTTFGGFTMSGDCTVVVATGVITCTKSSGVNISLGGALTTASTFTTSGVFPLTLTTTAATNVTLPLTGTLSTLAGSEALTNKTYNGNTWTAGTGVLTIAAAKTFTASNTLTLTATDGSTLAIGTGGTLGTAAYTAATAYVPSGTQITNSLGADVALNNTANYFTGPTVAQGSTGTWFCSGTVTVKDSVGASSNFYAKLWDGTSVADATAITTGSAGNPSTMSVSGYLASPAGNIRISVRDLATATGVIMFNVTGESKDSTLSCFRVQ